MKIKIIFLLTPILMGSLYGAFGEKDVKNDGPVFKMDYFIKAASAEDSGEVQLNLRIPYNNILFIRDKDLYRAKVDLALNIYNEDDRVGGFTDLQSIEIPADKMQRHQKKELQYQKRFILPYDKYVLSAVVTDINTQNKRRIKRKADLSVLDTRGWSMGNLYLAKSEKSYSDNSIEMMTFGFSASGHEGTEDFNYIIEDRDDNTVQKGAVTLSLSPPAKDYFFGIPIDSLDYNEYELTVSGLIGDHEFSRSIKFQVRWRGMNRKISNLDEAVRQMRYLMMTNFLSRDQYRIIEDSRGDMQKNVFIEYWKTIDPTPGTEENELMNEYYRRVNESTVQFSSHRPGWETDRGMVYTLFGPPDDKEVHTFEINSRPYIIWYYYTLNKYFVFVDYGGFGDFQLNQPIFDSLY